MNAIIFYQEKQKTTSKQLVLLQKKLKSNSVLRLATFILTFVFLFGLISKSILLAIILSSTSFIAFLALVAIYVKDSKKEKYLKALQNIIANELRTFENDYSNFDGGLKHQDNQHSFSYDLDIFGNYSVFQSINKTVTEKGEIDLANTIKEDSISATQIASRQESVKELSENIELLLHFRATGMVSGIVSDDRPGLIRWISTKRFTVEKKFLKVIVPLFTFFSLSTLIWVVLNPIDIAFLIIPLVVNFFLIGINVKKINLEHNALNSFNQQLMHYQRLLQIIEKETFKSELLHEQSKKLINNGYTVSLALKKISQLINRFDSRLNIVVVLFLEGFLLWDYYCLFAIEKWQKNFGEKLVDWLDTVAFFDQYISLANYAFNNTEFVYPAISSDMVFKANQIGHPLLASKERVNNDFILDSRGRFVIITGANMAGKSTFLRTIGVNLILAKSGLPVCATSMEFYPLKLFTSMRTSDSLAAHESYFYAELRRLKELVEKLEQGEKIFIILDEILKGTNSTDKQEGSKLVLDKILKLGGTGIIATHDLSLTSMEENHPGQINNFCFEIEIDNAEIFFDYKLYKGITQKMNAMLLMKQMGIIG